MSGADGADACRLPGEKTLATFTMRRAADYRRHLPNMRLAPELDDDEPAMVVVYDGPVRMPPTTGGVPWVDPTTGLIVTFPPDDGIESGVVCVVHRGEPNWYFNVDSTGLTPVITSGPSGSASGTPGDEASGELTP